MTREQLLALNLTEDLVGQIMAMHGAATQANNAELARLKGIETEYNNLKNNPPKTDPEPEPEDPRLADALKQISQLKDEISKKDIAGYASEKGLTGDQVSNILKAFGTDVESAKSAIDSISQIISDADKNARDEERKNIQKDTPNPEGTPGGKEDDKPEDVKNAELISFGSDAPDEATRNYYVLGGK